MFRYNKKLVIISSVLLVVTLSLTLGSSFSQSPLNDIAEKMSSSSGLTTIKISGESSVKIPQDATRLSVNIMTKPTELNSLEDERKIQVNKVINAIKDSVGEDKVTISTGYTYYNPQWSSGTPDMSSISAHIEIPVKIKVEDITAVSKIITEQGFWVNNLQIKKEPKSSTTPTSTGTSKVTISPDASVPNCEIANECFMPYEKVASVDQKVSWENLDTAAHTVTSGKPEDGPDGMFDSGLFSPGSTFEFVFDSVGEYDYFCMVHPWMIGKVTVVEGDSGKTEQTPTEYVYQASLTATIDLPPDNTDNSISKYQEKVEGLNNALSAYQLEDTNARQGTVNFNPTYWPSAMSSVFTSQTQLIIEVDYQDVETVLKAIKDSGSNFESFSLSYSAKALDSVRKDLTQKAIENAKERALEIVTPMGLEIKGIKSIDVKSSVFGNQYGNMPISSNGVMLRVPYDANQVNEAFVLVDVEFEVGK
ncbi:MAG: SIMPL domain-containing protein [Nitrososphaeraceae archaeon]